MRNDTENPVESLVALARAGPMRGSTGVPGWATSGSRPRSRGRARREWKVRLPNGSTATRPLPATWPKRLPALSTKP